MLCFVIVKRSFVPSLWLKIPKRSKIKFLRQSRAKNTGKNAEVQKKV